MLMLRDQVVAFLQDAGEQWTDRPTGGRGDRQSFYTTEVQMYFPVGNVYVHGDRPICRGGLFSPKVKLACGLASRFEEM